LHITESQVAAACDVASRVYAGQMTTREGAMSLSSVYGLNKSSALAFISDYKHMMEGRVFKRTMSVSAMRHFIEQISVEHGMPGLTQALTSLRAHIEYLESHYKTTSTSLRVMVEDFETLLQERRNVSEIQEAFEADVAKSLLDTPSTRLQRLAHASKKPKTIFVQSTFFVRNPDVVAEVLLRASGVCERCKREAPFRRAKDGTPYLEVHHKVQLANGGDDSIENAIALCPNCHREAHYGVADA
jgi:5-methylcytosine-specific restriction enzyme A